MSAPARIHGRHGAHGRSIPAIAPVARAIRIGIAMLALSAPVVTLAGNGVAVAPVDLTRVPLSASVVAMADNHDVIVVDGYGDAVGLSEYNAYAASVSNLSSITANATGLAGDATSYGVESLGGFEAYLANVVDATIVANADTVDGDAMAVGAYSSAGGVATLLNYGSIDAHATSENGDASAYGAVAYSGGAGIGLMINGGDVSATATGANATAQGLLVSASVASIFNDATASATAIAQSGGTAEASAAHVFGSYVAIENNGSLSAFAQAEAGLANAIGLDAFGYYGASAVNVADITVVADAAGGEANATGVRTIGYSFDATTSNDGDVSVLAQGEAATAAGLVNATYYIGIASVTNAGDVTVDAHATVDAAAIGAYDLSWVYDATIVNTGGIVASAVVAGGDGQTVQYATAIGSQAVQTYGFDYGAAHIDNGGSIASVASVEYGIAQGWGAVAQSRGPLGNASIDNTGDISVYGHADIGLVYATGAYLQTIAGYSDVVNEGDIVASGWVGDGYAYVTGINAISAPANGYYGAATIENHGRIEAHATGHGGIVFGRAIQMQGDTSVVNNAAGATVLATAETELFGGAFATAISVYGKHAVDIVNDGDIVAYGLAHDYGQYYGASRATGIEAVANMYGDISIVNNGDITATSVAVDGVTFFAQGVRAVGIDSYAKYDAIIDNSGTITATGISEIGIASAYGGITEGKYYGHFSNSGDIVAYASVGTLAGDYAAGRSFATGTALYGSEIGLTENTGSITAYAITHVEDNENAATAISFAFGAKNAATQSSTIINAGDIAVSARADFGFASAYGTFVQGGYAGLTTNTGAITAIARSDNGNALAVGAYTYAQIFEYQGCDETGCHYAPVAGDARMENAGDIGARASAVGGLGYAYGTVVIGLETVSTSNTGRISAWVDADDALAIGSLTRAVDGSATLDNSGVIVATAYGAEASATGAFLSATGDAIVHNTGTIAAFGDGERIAISVADDAHAVISNGGVLVGAIRTGALDDAFNNAAGGAWRVVGESDFGAGANRFTNAGMMQVEGDASLLLGASNILRNDGTLGFIDGDTDDALTLVGDLAGNGRLAFDVDGITGAHDALNVQGNVAAGTQQLVDVALIAMPTSTNTEIQLVSVTGDADAQAFALGRVTQAADGFLSMAFQLGSHVDASNATPDLITLGVQVDGLNAMGTLGTALAPGVQALVETQVGTWRERMGVVRPGPGVLAPFVRWFSDSGDIDGTHAGLVPTQGDAFHQSTTGWEAGLEARPVETVAVGALVAVSDATQRLDAGGEDRMDATTFGLFATWMPSDAAYVDASYRWIGVDAELRAASGVHESSASAQAFNVEGGYAWTMGNGLRLMPQLQYTWTRIADLAPLDGAQSTFTADGSDVSRWRAGVLADTAIERNGVVWTPYASLNAVHVSGAEFDYAVNDAFAGVVDTNGTSALVEGGLGFQQGAWSVTGGLHWLDGGSRDGAFGGQVVLRRRW